MNQQKVKARTTASKQGNGGPTASPRPEDQLIDILDAGPDEEREKAIGELSADELAAPWLACTDARNSVLYGDPAASLFPIKQ